MLTQQDLATKGIMLEDITDMAKPLTVAESLINLAVGNTLLAKGLERAKDADILVRLNKEHVRPVTEISYDTRIVPAKFKNKRYWTTYDLVINSLAYARLYKFDETVEDLVFPEFSVGDIVYYKSADNTEDSAIVTKIWRSYKLPPAIGDAVIGEDFLIGRLPSIQKDLYYSLSRDEGFYLDTELTGVCG